MLPPTILPWTMQLALASSLLAAPQKVSFSQAAQSVPAFDYLELAVQVDKPDAPTPFVDASVHGIFSSVGGSVRTEVDGFCDSADGSVFRIRFMPAITGDYTYSVTYRQGAIEVSHAGAFTASASGRRGPVR